MVSSLHTFRRPSIWLVRQLSWNRLDFQDSSTIHLVECIREVCREKLSGSTSLRIEHLRYTPENFRRRSMLDHARYIAVEEGGQHCDPLGPSVFDSAPQLVLLTVHRVLPSLESPLTIRAYLDDISAAGSAPVVSATSGDVTALSAEINLVLSTCKCTKWPDLRPSATSTCPPTYTSSRRPKFFIRPTQSGRVRVEGDRHSLGSTRNHVGGACQTRKLDPRVAVILLCSCISPLIDFCPRSHVLHGGPNPLL